MLIFESNSGHKKICIWIDETPFNCIRQNKMQLTIEANETNWHVGTICIEAKLNPRHISNYAMICMQYNKNQTGKVDISVNYGKKDVFYKSQVLPFNKSICMGLDKEFADAIYEYFEEYPLRQLPPGTIEIIGGGYDEVGSSNVAFKQVMQLLVYVYQNIDNMSYDTLKTELLSLI